MRRLGYLVNTSGGPEGEPGLFYDYILAGNGLFVRARGPLLAATVMVAPAEVRGLAPLEEKAELTHGRIPRFLHDLAVGILAADPTREQYLAITWEGEYRLRKPPQEGEPGGVEYEPVPGAVLDIHSHGAMHAFWSGTDNQDEQGLRLSMVEGRLDMLLPEVELRVGVYGYFAPLAISEIFM